MSPTHTGKPTIRAANSWIGSRPERLTTGRQDSSGQESWTFQEIFGRKYPQLASFGKPIMVAAFGSLAVVGVRAACFHAKDDQTITDQKFDCSIESNPALARTVAAAIRTWAPESAPQPREELSTRKQSAWTAPGDGVELALRRQREAVKTSRTTPESPRSRARYWS
jgi:hypothetical protein